MNPKILLLSATLAATATLTSGLINPVINGLSLQLPLLAGASGSFAFPLAVLGVLKLAAAAAIAGVGVGSLALGEGGPSIPVPTLPQSQYGQYSHYRQRRSADLLIGDADAVFGLVSSMDMYSCGKALICGLKAKDESTLDQDEIILLALFADRKAGKSVNPGSPKAEYDLAAELGIAARDEVVCRKRYNTCPYTTSEMMTALRSSQL